MAALGHGQVCQHPSSSETSSQAEVSVPFIAVIALVASCLAVALLANGLFVYRSTKSREQKLSSQTDVLSNDSADLGKKTLSTQGRTQHWPRGRELSFQSSFMILAALRLRLQLARGLIPSPAQEIYLRHRRII